MRILLDECVNARIRTAFPGLRVQTVSEAGWFTDRSFGVILILVPDNRIESFRPLFEQLRTAVLGLKPGSLTTVFAR